MPVDREAFRFFLDHAGYATPPGRAVCALQLARAEATMREAIETGRARIVWELDELEPIIPDGMTEEEYAHKFETGEWEGPYVCVLLIGEETAGALGGIELTTSGGFGRFGTYDDGTRGWSRDPYARVIEAELALEAMDELEGPIAGRRGLAPLLDNIA